MSAVLIAGCGYVGAALAAELAADLPKLGSEVRERVIGLKRDPRGLPDSVLPFSADLLRPATLDALPEDIDRVVYAVGASARTEEAYEDAYVRGLEHLLEALSRRARVRRLLFTSSTAVYGQADGSVVDESSPTEPTRFTGRVLLRAERIARDGADESASLRLAGIYGPGRSWLVRRVAAGEVRVEPPGAPPTYGNRIHRDDCAGALRHLLGLETLAAVYLGVDDAPAPLADVYRFVAERLGLPPPAEGEPDVSRGGNKRISNARLKASGYRLRVPTYREGYPEIIGAFQAESSG